MRVEGLRLVKRHIKKGRDRANPEGGILERPGSIALARSAWSARSATSRPGWAFASSGDKKVRFCKKCDATID